MKSTSVTLAIMIQITSDTSVGMNSSRNVLGQAVQPSFVSGC